ncbi:MAG TPA: carbohydrate porin [Kofleriaceae bacterium]|nr:carbohydrate porin [Kofleriaceae bacterium]
MRFSRLALALAFGASPAWAQPAAGEPPAETPKDPPKESPKGSADEKPVEPQSSKPVPIEVPQVRTVTQPEVSPTAEKAEEEDLDLDNYHAKDRGFRFGSYGRVLAGSDLRGGKPQKVSIVAHGPRIVEDSYLELEFSYGFERQAGSGGANSYIIVRPIVTLAFAGTLFHDTGQFDAQPALRNMFLDGQVGDHLTLWVGSRMYRGDDIYLFDYWPLDDINTVGGGLMYKRDIMLRHDADGAATADSVEIAGHIGFNRLNNPFQFQEVEVANPVQGATTVEQLNRQRTVASASAAYVMMPTGAGIGAKLKVHGEFHSLPSGTFKRMDGTLQALPSDTGFLIGAELGAFGFSDDSRFRRHLNLFTRYAKGLAAFDELAPPTSFGADLKTGRANEFTFGISGNWDTKFANMMVGVLSRRFVDADEDTVDSDDGWEYAVDARPLVRVPTTDFFVGGDISYQSRFPRGLNNITLKAEDPAVFQIAPMLTWSPMGPSSYDRPQIRLVYRAAYLNDAALDQYVPDDPRHSHKLVHFLGLQAEWWFNSSTYR